MTRWIFISDLQLEILDPHEKRKRQLIERVAAEKPRFVIHGGDHINGTGNDDPEDVERMWAAYHRVMAPLEECCPVISTIGNHDQTGSTPSCQEYLRQVGRKELPAYHARTIGGVHLAILDTVSALSHGGFLDRTQARWLRRDLGAVRRARATVVVGHFPLVVAPWFQQHSVLYKEKLGDGGPLPIQVDAGIDLYLCGHRHAYERVGYKTMTQVMTSASDFILPEMRQPCEYRRAFDERQTYIRFELDDLAIRGAAVSAEGEVIDAWTQKLNR